MKGKDAGTGGRLMGRPPEPREGEKTWAAKVVKFSE